jgi:DNA-binding transcriptional regulator GbsR (MarR family)
MSEPGPREKVIRAMEEAAELYSFNESYARLYGVLYFRDEEMTLDELVEETGFSKSTVSRGTSRLEDMYLVESRKKEGEGKTKFFSAEENLEHAFMEMIRNEASREIEIMNAALEEAEKEMKEQGDEEGLEKIQNLKKFYSRSEKIIELVKKLPSRNALREACSGLKSVVKRDS